MYLELLLLSFVGLNEWHVVEGNCGSLGRYGICDFSRGVYYERCPQPSNASGQASSNHGTEDATVIQCGQDNYFDYNPQKFDAPDNVDTITITELSIPENVTIKISGITCERGPPCIILKLNSSAVAPIVIRLRTKIIRMSAIRPPRSEILLKFTCNSPDRSCAKLPNNTISSRRTNGENATANEFPFMARLNVYRDFADSPAGYEGCEPSGYDDVAPCITGGQYATAYCGGSIIHENWILTSAHCVRRIDDSRGQNLKYYFTGVMVNVGDHQVSVVEPTERLYWVKPSAVIRRADYDDPVKNDNDIALLRLVSPIELDIYSRYPICLPSSYMVKESFIEAEVTLTGWGGAGYEPEDLLMKANFEVISQAQCAAEQLPGQSITGGMICASEDGRRAGNGDRGGPAFCTTADGFYMQIGDISFGYPDVGQLWKEDKPVVNARTTEFLQWIVNTLNGYGHALP